MSHSNITLECRENRRKDALKILGLLAFCAVFSAAVIVLDRTVAPGLVDILAGRFH